MLRDHAIHPLLLIMQDTRAAGVAISESDGINQPEFQVVPHITIVNLFAAVREHSLHPLECRRSNVFVIPSLLRMSGLISLIGMGISN